MRPTYPVVLFLLLLVTGHAWSQDIKKQKAVVSGQMRAASTDAKGNILTFEIMVGDEGTDQEPYQVVLGPKGLPVDEIKKWVGEWIVAAGFVTEDKLGWKSIEISKILPADHAKPQQ